MRRPEKRQIIPALPILPAMRRVIVGFAAFFYILLLWGCANQTTPTGGPKDETPPRLLRSVPANKERNFKGKNIELVFDETVALNNPKDEILISPTTQQEVEFKVRKNIVTITPKEGWKDSTTYSISFREGIRDITENNAPQNLKLAFSTGPSIDSMLVAGRVKMAMDIKIPEKITVALYERDTFNIFEDKPNYFTLIDKKATYSLENIKRGTYYIYAFKDNNKNLKVESRTEKFAFLANPIDLTGPVDSLVLPLVGMDMRPLAINYIRNNGLLTKIKFNKNIVGYQVRTGNGQDFAHSFGDDQTEVSIYNPKPIKDSLEVFLHASDSIQSLVDTVFYIKPVTANSIPADFKSTAGPIGYNLKTNLVVQEFTFSKPVKSIHFDSLFIRLDSLNKIPLTKKDITYDTIFKKLKIAKAVPFDSLFRKPPPPPLPGDGTGKTKGQEPLPRARPLLPPQPELTLAKGAIISQEGDTLKPQKFVVPEIKKQSTGTLLVKVDTQEPYYIVQLTGTDGTVVEEAANVKEYAFEYLAARNYRIRVIIDRNNNGKWDPGNFFTREEPEPTWFYKTQDKKYDFPIRANWELGPIMLIF